MKKCALCLIEFVIILCCNFSHFHYAIWGQPVFVYFCLGATEFVEFTQFFSHFRFALFRWCCFHFNSREECDRRAQIDRRYCEPKVKNLINTWRSEHNSHRKIIHMTCVTYMSLRDDLAQPSKFKRNETKREKKKFCIGKDKWFWSIKSACFTKCVWLHLIYSAEPRRWVNSHFIEAYTRYFYFALTTNDLSVCHRCHNVASGHDKMNQLLNHDEKFIFQFT